MRSDGPGPVTMVLAVALMLGVAGVVLYVFLREVGLL